MVFLSFFLVMVFGTLGLRVPTHRSTVGKAPSLLEAGSECSPRPKGARPKVRPSGRLRDDLGALRKLRLIGYETTERSRKPWVITLTGLLVPRDCKATANKTGASSLHREGAGLQSVGSANPRGERPSDADAPQPFAQAPSTSNALRGVVLERRAPAAATDDEAFFAALEKVRSARGAAWAHKRG
jgi:hypothetical protein